MGNARARGSYDLGYLPIKVWRSDSVLLADAVTRLRTAMRNGQFTDDAMTGVDRSQFRSWVSAYFFRVPEKVAIRMIASRDVGHHTSGWWKNPDYERCEHLSLSCWDATKNNASIDQEDGRPAEIVEAFFGAFARLVWIESPAGKEGKLHDVHHYRVFCDEHWQPMLPRGEVYSRELTEASWKSWSDVQAAKAAALAEARPGDVTQPGV